MRKCRINSRVLTILEVDVWTEIHLVRARLEDQTPLASRRERELDLAIKTTWTEQCRIERVRAIRGHDDLQRGAQ